MLRNVKDLETYAISASDGEIGPVTDVYFDDDAWAIRYFVVDTGSWLSSRKVLISPISVHQPHWLAQSLPVSLTRKQVRSSPDIDTDKPVSRQNEEQVLGHYGYPHYWGGAGIWGDGRHPQVMAPGHDRQDDDRAGRERELEAGLRVEKASHGNDDPHLRSCNAILGYGIHATDGDIGHVAGFLVDDETWAIRFLIVDTSNWWIGHKVLIAPPWIQGVHWAERSVSVALDRESIRSAPAYDATVDWSDEQDLSLHQHYGRSNYRQVV